MTQLSNAPSTPTPDQRIVIGIDWADREHVVCVLDPQQTRPQFQTLQQQPEEIALWGAQLQARYPGRELCVALETSQGPLFHTLLAAGCLTLFPVNPKQLARFREVLHPTGKKDDQADAHLLARLLLQHPGQLRPTRPDDELTRKLARLTELRRALVEQQVSVVQQLAAALKLSFPSWSSCSGSDSSSHSFRLFCSAGQRSPCSAAPPPRRFAWCSPSMASRTRTVRPN